MKKQVLSIVLLLALCLAACGTWEADSSGDGSGISTPGTTAESSAAEVTETEITKMKVQIGNASFTATLEDNAATRELIRRMEQGPITIAMSDYGGFEKVGPLGYSLPTENRQTTTSAGDIVLYNGDQIVLFYGSNTWSYTPIGRIDDLTGWASALGCTSVSVVFSPEADS